MYVTDTHSFLWHLQYDENLSSRAKSIFEACDNEKEIIVVPSIVLIESIFVCEKRKIDMEFQEILDRLKAASNYRIYPLDEDVAFECAKIDMKEPHDRIIVATSRLLNVPLITNDRKITESKFVEIVW